MLALTVSDWTNIAVAIGTFLLASASFYATLISRWATKEAYRSRIDSSAPRLVVLDLKIQQGVETPETVTAGNFGFVNAGSPIAVAEFGDGNLGKYIEVEIANHGASSGYVELEFPADVAVKSVTLLNSTPGNHDRSYSNHVVLLQPLGRVTVKLVWRQSATTWSQEPDFPLRIPQREVIVKMRDTLRSMEDSCTITFGSYALMPTPSNPGGWNVAPLSLFQVISQGGSNSLENIGQIGRTYPKEHAETLRPFICRQIFRHPS
jgi:hypothetical protein